MLLRVFPMKNELKITRLRHEFPNDPWLYTKKVNEYKIKSLGTPNTYKIPVDQKHLPYAIFIL